MTLAIDRPAFTVGCGRSGTTLAYALLAQRPDVGWFSNYTDRRYEELVKDPAAIAAIVAEFVELRYGRNFLESVESLEIRDKSGKYRCYLANDQILQVETTISPIASKLSYRLDCDR